MKRHHIVVVAQRPTNATFQRLCLGSWVAKASMITCCYTYTQGGMCRMRFMGNEIAYLDYETEKRFRVGFVMLQSAIKGVLVGFRWGTSRSFYASAKADGIHLCT